MFGKNNLHLINIIQLMGKEEHGVLRSTNQGAQSEQREQGDG